MIERLQRKINTALRHFIRQRMDAYHLPRRAPFLPRALSEFVLRGGKRIRPVLFLLSVLGHSRKPRLSNRLLVTSLAFELLHDFLLIHDDIIDNAPLRRGKPTLHKVFQRAFGNHKKTGKDISIIAGDIIFAMAIEAFLVFPGSAVRKEAALRSFLSATVLTGAGECLDIVNGLLPVRRVSEERIYQNYRLKTAEYTFKAPLRCGCILAGGNKHAVDLMDAYGQCLGEAFQSQDDLIGIYQSSRIIGKSVLSDLIEAKKTIPIRLAFSRATPKERKFIESCLGNQRLRYGDLQKIRKIMVATGAFTAVRKSIEQRIRQASKYLERSPMHNRYKKIMVALVTRSLKA